MSFLANLRQQSDSSQSLQLCYVIRIDAELQLATLNLYLHEIDGSTVRFPGKPYFIQQQHLEHPPTFLQGDDIRILKTLISLAPSWNQNSHGEFPEEQSWGFIGTLIDSGRCFLDINNQWCRVQQGEPLTIYVQWHTDTQGAQTIEWQSQLASGQTFFTCNQPLSLPLVYLTQASEPGELPIATLSQGQSDLSERALAALEKYRQPLSPDRVETFLAQFESRWEHWGLPLPKNLPTLQVDAIVTALLCCRSVKEPREAKGIRDELHLMFAYSSDNCSLVLDDDEDCGNYWNGEHIVRFSRNHTAEEAIQKRLSTILEQFSPLQQIGRAYPKAWYSRSTQDWQALLTTKRSELEKLDIKFVIDKAFRHHYVLADSWNINIEDNDDNRIQLSLELTVENEIFNLRELLDQLHEYNQQHQYQKEKYPSCFHLPDGRLLVLPEETFTSILEDLSELETVSGKDFSLPRSQLHRLGGLHDQLPSSSKWKGDLNKLQQAINIHQTPVMLDMELDCIDAKLRPYQWLGVCWMQHIKQHGINGLLADDMGLGKTLQALSHICLEHKQCLLNHPALIVVPTSLLHNWEAEIKRFAPHLRCQIIHGPNRHQFWPRLNEFDIVISSYQLIANDLERWQNQLLSWVILDEAQVIKNSRTRASQAVRQLESEYKLCLSGTPVENHLGELWSILDFLMPGCLGNYKSFKSQYQRPIEQDGNTTKLRHLLKQISPFMLRRSKDQIAKDLPEKTEIYKNICLEDDQLQFYSDLKTSGWSELQEQLAENENSGQQQMLVLTALLKLRQACCDPLLLGEEKVSSAKREHCIDMITELVAEKRAVLVFSQFTSMLELLAESLDEADIAYLTLTGKSRNRQKLVDRFQAGEAPVFLISLKAGGVGLNLTRADTVIHYDPWWNSAAEQQATDRAHRIGQDKPVFVYKLIAENTIEEKIALLQQRKAMLSQHVNNQAQVSGESFALKLEDLLNLWHDENKS